MPSGFQDRDEVLAIVVARAFEEMSSRSMAAVEAAGVGTLAGIVAMGQAYVSFAEDEQRLFRLIFGQHPILKEHEAVLSDGMQCFSRVIEQVAIYCDCNNVKGDPKQIAVQLWTFVHGAASLLIDQDYEMVAPEVDAAQLITDTTPFLLKAG